MATLVSDAYLYYAYYSQGNVREWWERFDWEEKLEIIEEERWLWDEIDEAESAMSWRWQDFFPGKAKRARRFEQQANAKKHGKRPYGDGDCRREWREEDVYWRDSAHLNHKHIVSGLRKSSGKVPFTYEQLVSMGILQKPVDIPGELDFVIAPLHTNHSVPTYLAYIKNRPGLEMGTYHQVVNGLVS